MTPSRPALLGLVLGLALAPVARAQSPETLPADSTTGPLRFEIVEGDTTGEPPIVDEGEWLRTPFGDRLITDRDEWEARQPLEHGQLRVDYNRVDRLRLGVGAEAQSRDPMMPRLGGRLEYAFGRERVLYGVAIEQPLARPGRLVLGVSMLRRTDHSELQQVEDLENSLALLVGRQDYRDYFEREGVGAHLAWRVPDFSTVSVHLRRDEWRSLPLDAGTRSWFNRDRPLRDNPGIDAGTTRSVLARSERLAHRTRATRAGLYHWLEVERAGGALGGDFTYTRALADARSVVRLSPATTLLLRGVVGTAGDGRLPRQREFTVGGVDGLRAHSFAAFRGDQLVLAQAEYVVDLWHTDLGGWDPGLHVLAFVDAGRAWTSSRGRFDVGDQRLAADGGFGLGTSDGDLRVYFAKDLQKTDSDFVINLRLQRPF